MAQAPRVTKQPKPKLLFKFLPILVLLGLVVTLVGSIFGFPLVDRLTCPVSEQVLELEPDLKRSTLILNSALFKIGNYDYQKDNMYRKVVITRENKRPNYMCGSNLRKAVGFVEVQNRDEKFPYLRGDDLEREEFKVVSAVYAQCNNFFVCIDSPITALMILAEDKSGKLWAIHVNTTFNDKAKDNPDARYYAHLVTAEGEVKDFVPDAYFTPDEGLRVSE